MEIYSALQSFQCDVPSDSEDSMSDSSLDEELLQIYNALKLKAKNS